MPLTPRPLAPLALRLVEIPGIPRVRGVQAVGLARLPTLIRGGASPLRRAAEQHPAQHRDLLRQLRDPGIGLRERLLGPLGTLTPVRHISGVTGHRREGHVLQNTPSPSNTPRTAPGVSRTKPQPRRRPRLQTHAALTPHVTTGGHSDSARPPTGSPNTYAAVKDICDVSQRMHECAQEPVVYLQLADRRAICEAVGCQVPLDTGPAQIGAIDQVVLLGELPVTFGLTDAIVEFSLGTGRAEVWLVLPQQKVVRANDVALPVRVRGRSVSFVGDLDCVLLPDPIKYLGKAFAGGALPLPLGPSRIVDADDYANVALAGEHQVVDQHMLQRRPHRCERGGVCIDVG